MGAVFPDIGLGVDLAAFLSGLSTLTIHLAKNNVTITRASILTDFLEANFSGYASQTIGAWGTPVYDATNHRYTSTAPPVLWQNSTGGVGNSIYAIYVTNGAGVLIFAEEVTGGPSTPVDMTTAGKVYVYTPIVADYSFYSTSP
jgi:hypothetical protein